MNDKEKLLEKLKKLFALGNSPNQHEAEAALAKANQLMQEHQISMSDVDVHDMGNVEQGDTLYVREAGSARHWVYQLADAAARLFDGRAIDNSTTESFGFRFVGTPTDMQAMRMMFEHLWKSWMSIVEADLRSEKDRVRKLTIGDFYWPPATTMKYKHGHGTGFAQAIGNRVYALVKARQQEVNKTATGRELVVVKGQQLKEWMDRHTTTGRSSGGSSGSSAGQNAGRAAGEKVPLGGGIGGTSQQLRIGGR